MKSSKRVLLVVPRMNIGGAESHVVQVARALKSSGWDVEVASGGGALAEQLEKEGISQKWVPIRWNYSFAVWRLKNIVQNGKYDLIHAHSNATGSIVARVAEETKTPWIYTAHTGLRPPRIEEFAKAELILAVSEFTKKIILEKGKEFLDPNKIVVLHNAIDCNYFSSHGKRMEVRESWGVKENNYVVGIVARLLKPERKGHYDLIQILSQVNDSNWKLAIIGKAHWWYGGTRKVAQAAKKAGVADRLIWVGHQVDVRPALEGCDVAALPSLSESFGLALAEAMAMEKPVVAYDGSGTEEVVGNNEGGYLVPKQNIEAFENALKDLSDLKQREEMGRKARERIKRLYDLPAFMGKLLQIYDEILNKKP